MEKLENCLEKLCRLGGEKYAGQEDYGENVTTEEMMEAMKIVALEEESLEIVDRIGDEDARKLFESLLIVTLSNWHQARISRKQGNGGLDDALSPDEMRKSRIAIRFLVNLVQRSEKFTSKMQVDTMDHIECLLAVQGIEKEILVLLMKTAHISYIEFQKNSRYSSFLEKVVELYYRAESKEIESLALAYFSILLEKDYALLANCYAEMEEYQFLQFLGILETLMSEEETRKCVHSNNLLFILNLLELVCDEYESYQNAQIKRRPKSWESRRKWTAGTVKSLVGIVGEMCTNHEMSSHLNDKINSIVDVLDAILHSEALFAEYRETVGPEWPAIEQIDCEMGKAIREERRIEMARMKHPDRPAKPKPGKILRIETSDSLRNLSEAFLETYKDIKVDYGVMGELKLNCLKTIANLCGNFPKYKIASTQNGRMALLSVLQCTAPRPLWFLESYAIQKWAIFCVRQLTDDCQENSEAILNLEQPDQPIVNREKLLNEFGLKSMIDEKTGRQKLVRIDEEEIHFD